VTRAPAVAVALLLAALVPASASAIAPPKDRYIVVLKDSADSAAVAKEHGRKYGVTDRIVYGSAIEGYAGMVPPGQLAKIKADPRVESVQADGVVHAVATESNPPWGLDRIDQRALPLSHSYTYARDGTGVKAYVIDTGIRLTHTQFGGRAVSGFDFVDNDSNASDCDGHGTHVSGTIGGSTYGVAKNVSLVAVRVLDCNGSGYWSWVIAGIDWVTSQHQAGQPAVANMSLGGGASSSVDTAVSNSINDGVTYSIAAGNSNRNACNYTPARVPNALTIGATTSTDARASYSNYGSCVDWFAPGSSILSSYNTSDTATATLSGTSMAAPHTAGAVALYLQGNPTASPATVRSALFGALTTGVVTNSSTTNNHLLYVGSLGPLAPDGSPPAAPTALSATAGDAQVSLDWADNSESDLAGYNVYRSTTSGGGYTKVNGALVTSSAYLDSTVSNATTYYYVVTAVDTSTNEGDVSNEASATPQAGATPPIALSASGSKVRGVKNVTLDWDGATSTDVDVVRNGVTVTTTTNDGTYSETLGKGSGSYTYKVCEAGTSTCSNESTVVF
jgi:subtilisin family serine protease